jgi:uncharacterized protein involved in outer membrane biogenesis
MKKRTVIKVILIFFVLISVLVAAAILFLKSERGNEYIRSALVDFVEDLTRSKIEIGNLHTDLFSSITLKNITMFNSHGMVPDTLLNAGTVHVRYDISSLLFGEIGADSVMISNFKAYVQRNDKGEFNLPDFIFNSDEDTDSTIPFHIGHAELKDASFIYDDQFFPINASVRDLNVLVNLSPKDHLYEFGINLQTAEINYFDDPIELDGLSLTGHIKKDFKELSTEFRTAISDVNFSGSAIADMDSLYGKIIISGIPEKLVEVLAGTNTADLSSDTLFAELDYKLKNLLSEP